MLNIESLQLALTKGTGALPESVAEELLRGINSGEYEAAARLASAAFQEGCSDIRCITAMLLGSFIERGPESIPEILAMSCYLLGDGWAAIEPKSRRLAMTDGALSQLLRSLKTLIDFHESVRDHVWVKWRKTIGEQLPPDCEQAQKELDRAMLRLGQHNRSAVALAALQTKIFAAFELAKPSAASASSPPEPEPEPKSGVERAAALELDEAGMTSALDEPSVRGVGDNSSLVPGCVEVSLELARFMAQLDAFAVLVERGDLTRAAIVAYDVRKTIDSFDPVRFLPSLFASHFQLLGSNIEQIAVLWEKEGTPQWQALAQHYRADLEGFVRG
ncbi:MAG TPA: type VI secretion system protein IglI family protein [Polyangiaceae bacterium]